MLLQDRFRRIQHSDSDNGGAQQNTTTYAANKQTHKQKLEVWREISRNRLGGRLRREL